MKIPPVALPIVPASFFGMVLGLIGLGSAWRAAHAVWHLPAVVGEAFMVGGSLVWAVLVCLFIGKWMWNRELALAEARHPVQCCFIGLAGVATMLVAVSIESYADLPARMLFVAGAAFTVVFAVWRTGHLWRGGRDPADNTPVLYLPTVAGCFVTAIAAARFGFADWGQLAFGAGLLSWLGIESVLIHRLYTAPEMPLGSRPALGIQAAPPAVAAAAYLSLTAGPPDVVASGLVGYAFLEFLLLARLGTWIFAGGVTASAWSFTFGATALATATVQMAGRGPNNPTALLAPAVLAAVTVLVAALTLRTAWLLRAGRLLPPAAQLPTLLPADFGLQNDRESA